VRYVTAPRCLSVCPIKDRISVELNTDNNSKYVGKIAPSISILAFGKRIYLLQVIAIRAEIVINIRAK
jgi:hypothetical protein